MSNGSGANRYYCNDCKLSMSAKSRRKFHPVFCMRCGENVSVVPYEKRDKGHEIPRRPWTTGEEAELRRLIEKKGKRPIELAERFNRTAIAIRKKAIRLGYKFD